MYQQTYKLTIRDMNYANHLDHLSLLNYLHETRVRLLREYGYNEINADGNGGGLIVINLQCNYRKEGFYGDEILVTLTMQKVSATRLNLHYEIQKLNENSALMATSDIIVVFLNSERKVIAIPVYLEKLCEFVDL